MSAIALSIQEQIYVVDTFLDQISGDFGGETYIRLGQKAAGEDCRALIAFRIPTLPAGAKLTNVHISLKVDALYGSASTKQCRAYLVTKTWSELDANWTDATDQSQWTNSGGDYTSSTGYYDIPDAAGDWMTIDMNPGQDAYGAGDFIAILVKQVGAWSNGDYVDFFSRHHGTAANRPKIIVDIDITTPNNLEISPNPDNPNQTVLKWTPVVSPVPTSQKVYRKKASSGVTIADEQIGSTLGAYDSEIIDDEAHDDGADYCYAVFTETAWNTGSNSFKSNEVKFQSPAVTVFYVDTVVGGLEGSNIDIQEKVHAHVTVSGENYRTFVKWGDGGERWWDPLKLTNPEHYYTTPGAKVPQARAMNKDGYWGSLVSTTGGHTAPNPQNIKPIARLDITPSNPAPFDEVSLDASRSYARNSAGTIGNKTFTAAGSYGLPSQPQSSPLATCYYKTTGVKQLKLKVTDNLALDSDEITKNATVSSPTVGRFVSVSDTNIEEVTPSKDRGIDDAPLLGTDGSEVISTGARATRYSLSGSCIGPNAEANLRTIENWALTGVIVDVPVYDDAGVPSQILRGHLQGFNRQIRGGEPYTKWFTVSVVVIRRLVLVVDEAVSYTAGVGVVANYPLADMDGDGTYIDDILVNTAAGGGGTPKPVDSIDYPSDTISNGLKEITLTDTGFTATGYTTYWYEVRK